MEEGSMSFSRLAIGSICLLAMISVGCQPKKPAPPPQVDYLQELPPGSLALRKISPSEYPTFRLADAQQTHAMLQAIDYSVIYLEKPSSATYFPYLDISHERALATLHALRDVIETQLEQAPGAGDLNETIRAKFDVYKSIGGYDQSSGQYTGNVLFTGYFTPIYSASPTRTAEFQWPIYKRPGDLVTSSDGARAFRKMPDGSLVPYYSRAQIETGQVLAGQELAWLQDRFDAYVITVQGSAKLRMPDGRIVEVGYAGNNGYEYVSPGKRMLADGVITRDQLSLRGIKAYFASHPASMEKYLTINPRTVFFKETAGGPYGSLGQPVTPMATIATDKQVYPRALAAFLSVQIPDGSGGASLWEGFMLDQDTGGGIRAAGRCDIYMGIGPAAEARAGQQLYAGQLYYLALKPELIASYSATTRPAHTAPPRQPQP
jgi:membrane-bound lytic murein transglycosylase A